MSETAPPAEPSGPSTACEICRTIPDRVSSSSKGDETWGGPIPPAVGRLVIVGAPYFNGDTSGSNQALHKCPLCGTFYWWEHEYEYLAGGSEDSDTYTRLDPETGAGRERECLDQVAAARERCRVEAAGHVAALVASADDATISRAASLVRQARRWEFDVDLSGALPALVDRCVRLPQDGGPGCLQYDLRDLLDSCVGTNPESAREVLRIVRASDVIEPSRFATELVARCEAVLAARAGG